MNEAPAPQPQPTGAQPEQSPSAFPPMQPIDGAPAGSPPKNSKKQKIAIIISIVVGVLLIAAASVIAWYFAQLQPVDSANTDKQLVSIEVGSTPNDIADTLQEKQLIRDATAFLWYTRFEGVQNTLQAGTYRLSPSESTPEIVDHLVSGKVDTFSITFLPGATLADNREALISAGYSSEEVDQALAQEYDSPLFAGKPASADLEGYIYGETYTFGTETPVSAILEHTFEEYYSVIEENDLVARYEAQGLSLFEGITLASIIQREASPGGEDMPQIAQVFYSRLAIGMPLGSDVTYQYIADKLGLERSPELDNPYNTRIYPDLPPGPIASPGEKALIAVAQPAEGDYLYFLSGDDDITYFGRTIEEHNANIQAHCAQKCQIL